MILRDTWILWKQNDRRNPLAGNRLNHDVHSHTNLSPDGGQSGNTNLAHIKWGNYDLVVIDDSTRDDAVLEPPDRQATSRAQSRPEQAFGRQAGRGDVELFKAGRWQAAVADPSRNG